MSRFPRRLQRGGFHSEYYKGLRGARYTRNCWIKKPDVEYLAEIQSWAATIVPVTPKRDRLLNLLTILFDSILRDAFDTGRKVEVGFFGGAD